MKGCRGMSRKGRNGEVEHYPLIVQAKNVENAGDLPEVGADTDGVALCVAHDGTLRRTLWTTLLTWLQERINAAILNHAERHAAGGSDPITPASIGAADANHTHEEMANDYLPLNGGDMAGNIDMSNHFLTGLPAPVAPSDAVNYQTLLRVLISQGIETVARITYNDSHQMEQTVVIVPQKIVGNRVLFYANFTMEYDQGGSMSSKVNSVSLKIPQQFVLPGEDWEEFDQFSDGAVVQLAASNADNSGSDRVLLRPFRTEGEAGDYWYSTIETIYAAKVAVSGYFLLDFNL